MSFFLLSSWAEAVDSFKEAPVSKILDDSIVVCAEETRKNTKQHDKQIQKDKDMNELENSKKQLKNDSLKRSAKRRMRNVFMKHIPRKVNHIKEKEILDCENTRN